MNIEFREIAAAVHDAESYIQLFPRPVDDDIRAAFRWMMKIVHPDRVPEAIRPEADLVMRKLNLLHDQARQALQDGTFGAADPILTLTTGAFRHDCLKQRTRWFDMTTGFDARTTDVDGVSIDSLVRIAREPRDNDLMTAESDALRLLSGSDAEHRPYYPTLLDSAVVQDGRRRLRANVTVRLDGFFNLGQVRERHPAGIDVLDMGWIWRRMLWALGGVHEAGLLHGALVPSHIMIHPTLHGVVLVDWCYSVVRTGDEFGRLSAVVGPYRDWYPDAVLSHTRKPTEALDLAMAARCMRYLTQGRPMPDEMLMYFAGITSGAIDGSAYELLARFDRILERLGAPYYPRSYRPLNW